MLYEKNGTKSLWYYYDASGAPIAFSLTAGKQYVYRKDLQGDITGVYSGSTGELLVSYVYDAWGKVTATDVAGTTESADVLTYNPYLYRGYRYDAETGLYYLNSRYYDPETGRFINADSILDLNHGNRGTNLFTYAVNNPQSYKDKAGTDAILINDFGEEGMPVVGHARLFIQDEAGNWYFTEFAGRNKDLAEVTTFSVDELNEKYELLQSLIKKEQLASQQSVYIEGDFTKSVKFAQKQNGTNFNGYKLITNNCVNYARTVLSKGNAKGDIVNKAIRNSKALTTGGYMRQIKRAKSIYNALKKHKFLIMQNIY